MIVTMSTVVVVVVVGSGVRVLIGELDRPSVGTILGEVLLVVGGLTRVQRAKTSVHRGNRAPPVGIGKQQPTVEATTCNPPKKTTYGR